MRTILTDKKVFAWALYDWGNSAFSTTVIAGFFPVFYSVLSSGLSVSDSRFWFNMTLAISSAMVAIAAPVLGAIADSGGSRKKFLATFSLLGILMCAGLAWVGAAMWWAALIVYGLEQIGFSGAIIFYDVLIVEVSSEEDMDVVSGYGYALGYIGGGLLFLVSYWLYIDGVGTIFKTAVFFADRILGRHCSLAGWPKRIGPKCGILIGLLVYTGIVIYAWKWLNSATEFYWLAVTIGLVQGGVQSLSRSLFARLIPQSKTTEFFGFYNMVGKFANIFAPFLMVFVPIVFASSSARDSILVLVVLFVTSGHLLYRLDVDKAIHAKQALDSHNQTTDISIGGAYDPA